MRSRVGRRLDRGASTAEYAGLIVLAALILGVLYPLLPAPVEDGVSTALCKIFNIGHAQNCGKQRKSADERYKPKKCTTQLSYNQYGVDIDVSFVRVGHNLTFIKTKTSDGKVTLTAVEGGKAGAQASASAGLHLGKLINVGGGVSADATLNIGVGDGWTFDDDEKADQFISNIKKRATIDTVEHSGVAGWLGGHIYDAIDGPPDIRDPDIKRYEGAVDINGNGDLGLSFGPANPKGKHAKNRKDPKDKDQRGDNRVSPNAGGYVGINGNEKVIYERNSKTGQTSATYRLSGGIKGGENHFTTGGHQGHAVTRGAMTLRTDNKTGKLVGIDFKQTHIVNGHATVTTTTLPVTDENRQRVTRSLLREGPAGVSARTLSLNWDNMVPDHDPGPDASDLEKELFRHGQVQKIDYDYSGDTNSYGANAKLGPLALGGAYNQISSNQTVSRAQYLGAPGADGRRHFVPYKECHN